MPSRKKTMTRIRNFLLSLIICLGGGWLSGIVTENGLKNWYPSLIKAPGTPPSITFPIVWSILYIMMALSLTLFWNKSTSFKKKGILFFAIQLLLNFNWSWLFFYLQKPILGLIDIIFLWVFIFLTIREFSKKIPLSGYLLLPYLLWVSYAFYLNLFIFLYN